MAMSFLKGIFSKKEQEPTHAEKLEQVRESLRRGETEMARALSDHSFADFEAVTGDVANEASFDAKLLVAKELLRAFENCPQDHPNEFHKFGKSIQYCTDALDGFTGLKQEKKGQDCVQLLARMSASSYFNHEVFLNRVTQSLQSAGMVTLLNKNNMLLDPEHTDLVLDKNQDEDFKISFLKKRIKSMDSKDRPAFLEDIARTDGHPQTNLQKYALGEYLRQCETEVNHDTAPFIIAEMQAGSVETAKTVFPDYCSLENFAANLSYNETKTHRRVSDIVLYDIMPEELVGKRAAEVSNHLSRLALDNVQLGYLPADHKDIGRVLRQTHDSARLTSALSSRVLRDESAGHDAKMIATSHLSNLIVTEDKMVEKIDSVNLNRLNQHKTHEELRKTEEWTRYQYLKECRMREGDEINEIYVRNHADQDSHFTQRGLELLNNGVSIYGLRPDEKEEFTILDKKITEFDVMNPHITNNLTDSEKQRYFAYGYSYAEDQVLANLQSIKMEESKVGYGRAAVDSLVYNSDEYVIKLLTNHKLLAKQDKPAPRFIDMQGQSLKL
jgi:hypothetical protein